MSADGGASAEPVRIVRIIARLNIGGPAIQAITLTRELERFGYATTLVRGVEEPDEGSMDDLAERVGVEPVLVSSLRRNPGLHDFAALWALVRILRRERPALVHTHAAKGGTLGRLAALIAWPRRRSRPALVHTFHGHSLRGYFSPRANRFYTAVERFLAKRTDRLIAVSEEVRDDLVEFGVAPAEKFEVVRLGFDLAPFHVGDSERARRRAALRSELGISDNARVVTLVARLVPIKRVDRFLRIASALRDEPRTEFLIVGDGELRDQLRASREARELGNRITWAGFRSDMPDVYFASDVVVLTSDNEGTPVSLIEAQAAGVPVVSTAVGGTRTVVSADLGAVIAAEDEAALAAAISRFLGEPRISSRGTTKNDLSLGRLANDVVMLYAGLVDADTAALAERSTGLA